MKLNLSIDEKITSVKGFSLSSPYGDGKVFGQPKELSHLGLSK